MSNQILRSILISCLLLVVAIFFTYRGYGWPFGRESIEAVAVFCVLAICIGFYSNYIHKNKVVNQFQENVVWVGLLVGLLWTVEICMNNLVRPGLPMRDVYDNIFWGVIAAIIFITAIYFSFSTNRILRGIEAGFWSGFASGGVACLTALLFIVFGMSQILLDPLNATEWAMLGAHSGTPNITIYFAYQTLAGAILHLVILGIGMGLSVGVIGGVLGKGFNIIVSKK